MFKDQQRLLLFFYHTSILIIFNILVNYFGRSIGIISINVYFLISIVSIVIIISEQIFYKNVVRFSNKIQENTYLLLFILIVLFAFLFLVFLLPVTFWLPLIFCITILLFLILDVALYNITFNAENITVFERLFLWIMIIISGITMFSLVPGVGQKTFNIIKKYGAQATMLSFSFAFILFYIVELKHRKDSYTRKESDLINEKNFETLNLLLDKLSQNEKVNSSLEMEVKDLKAKLTSTESSLHNHINNKTAQIIRKTKPK
jgi:hypothetical protein